MPMLDPAPPWAFRVFVASHQLGLCPNAALVVALQEAGTGRASAGTVSKLQNGSAAPTGAEFMVLLELLGPEDAARCMAHAAGLALAEKPAPVDASRVTRAVSAAARDAADLVVRTQDAVDAGGEGGTAITALEARELIAQASEVVAQMRGIQRALSATVVVDLDTRRAGGGR